MKISSADVDDTSAGDGARTVQIYGLDANYVLQNEVITLNGRTAVETVGTYIRIWRMVVRTAGATESNEGIVYAGTGTVTDGVPANKFAAISVGQNQTLMAVWTVPVGKTALLKGIEHIVFDTPGGLTSGATIRVVARPSGETFQTKHKTVLTNSPFNPPEKVFAVFTEKTDVEVRAVVNANTAAVSAALRLEVLDNI